MIPKTILFYFLLGFTSVHAQVSMLPVIESFENAKTLREYDRSSNSDLVISDNHYHFGKSSLQWKWNKSGSYFGTSHFKLLDRDPKRLSFENLFPSSPTLKLSLYAETPQQDSITITFKKDGRDEVWFSLNLNFYGWRTIWVPFYEMQGNPPLKTGAVDYDYFVISTKASKGKLFFDDIIFSQYQDDRHQYPDLMVPFLKKEQDHSIDHWMPLIEYLNHIDALTTHPLDSNEVKDVITIQARISNDLFSNKDHLSLEKVKENFSALKLKTNKTTVNGPPLTYNLQETIYDSLQQDTKVFNDISFFGKTLKKIAIAFYFSQNETEKIELEKLFITASRYFLDQGWQKGASGGTRHHIGYAIRELTEAFYIMRNPLRKAGLIREIGESLQWLYNLGMIVADEDDFHVNIDYLNTQAYYHLIVIFLSESREKQLALLKAYAHYISIILAQEEEEWGFKPDGTSWHHNGHYPAYGLGAFVNVSKIIYTLSGTSLCIGTAGHKNFKRALLSTAEYCQLYDWGFGNAGRHPLESPTGNNIRSLQHAYWQMVNSGNPEHTTKIDKEVAAYYLRLWGKQDKVNSKIFNEAGVQEAQMPAYKYFPYGATAIHRRKDWAAIVKGYSKYLWSSEIYSNANRYGRYPANGTIELLNEEGEYGSGFVQDGWDWNRYPGATVVNLPLAALETDSALLMFLSEESFVGAAQLDENGVFAMVLNESKGSNADGLAADKTVTFVEKLRAKKSVFSFGEKLICIGSDISSVDTKNPVQTNLFQTWLKTPDMSEYVQGYGLVKDFPFSAKPETWVVDPYGNGYHLLSGGSINMQRNEQHSYNNKYSVRTGDMLTTAQGNGQKETHGNFATAWIDHGVAPQNASYQYVVYPFLSKNNQENFAQLINGDTSFTIIRADGTAHIVRNKETAETAYAIFDDKAFVGKNVLRSVSAPSIFMVQNNDPNSITISAVQPDLNFPVDKMKKNGFTNYSQPVKLSFTLEGAWRVENNAAALVQIQSNGLTEITIECRHGFSNVLRLKKENTISKKR